MSVSGSPSPAIPSQASHVKEKLFTSRSKPRINLAIICSDSSVDVASMARLMRFQLLQVLEKDSISRHYQLPSGPLPAAELEQVKQYIAELERAKAVQAGAPLHEEQEKDKGNDEDSGRGGKKKGGAAGSKRAGAARKQQAEETLVAMTPEMAKEIEEERRRLIDTYLKAYEFVSVLPNSVAEFDGKTQAVFLYQLLDEEEVLTPKEDGNVGDVTDAFWRTIEAAVPPELDEVTVVWAVSDPRLLRALKEIPIQEELPLEGTPAQRYVQPRLIMYANDGQFVDPTMSAATADGKRTSRFSMAKKGGGRKGGSQGSDGSRSSSRNSRGGKGGQKNAAAPSDSAPPNFFEAGTAVDEILYECSTFSDFIEKQTLLEKQKAEIQKMLDMTKAPNSECDARLRTMLAHDDPVQRLLAVNPEEMPSPLEAHLNMQMSATPSQQTLAAAAAAKPPGVATEGITTSASTSGRGVPTPPVESSGAATPSPLDGTNASVPPPDPAWSIIRTTQNGSASDDEWINICRKKGVSPIFELASIVSMYNFWRSGKNFTELPPTLKTQFARRRSRHFSQTSKDGFRPHTLEVADEKIFSLGMSYDELSSKNGPLPNGGFQVYEREKLLGGEFCPYTALMALISQATANLIRSQPIRLVQLEEQSALPPMLHAVCEQQERSMNSRPLFRVDKAADRVMLGDNHGTASVMVEVKPPVKLNEDIEERTTPPIAQNKGKDAKKPNAKRPPNAKHEVKEEAAPKVVEVPPKPTTWAYPTDHCHEKHAGSESLTPSPQEVEWLVRQYVKKGMGNFFYSKRGCSTSPAAAGVSIEAAGRPKAARSEILQALQRMKEFHSCRVGGELLPVAEEVNQLVFLFRTCYSFIQHLNYPSLMSALQDPRTAPVTPAALDCGWCQHTLWDKVPQDLISRLTRPLSHEEEQLKSSVERNLTARERAHVIQRSLLVEIARSVGLLPPKTKILEETPLNSEETISLPTALHRLSSLPLRFGDHIASIYSFASKEVDRANVEAVMADTYAAQHSKNAENVYPVRREGQFWVAGVQIPPRRRKNLIWVFPVSGCLPVDEFIAWKRWESGYGGTTTFSPNRQGPVTFTTSSFISAERDNSAGPPARHSKLASEFMEELLGKVLSYQNYHVSSESAALAENAATNPNQAEAAQDLDNTVTSQRGAEIKPPSEGASSHTFGKDLYLSMEGRQVLYPFCDAVVEISTTNYCRQCRFICTEEVTATLNYNIPPPITDEDISDLMQVLGKKSAPPEESAYLTVRFDDGLTLTIANRAKPPIRLPRKNSAKASRTLEDRASVTSIIKDNESVVSLTSKVKGHGKEKKKKEKRGHRRQSHTTEPEKPPETSQPEPPPPPQPPLCPPIAANGDVRLWTAREEMPEEAGAETITSAAFASSLTGRFADSKSFLFGQKGAEETIKLPERRVEPLDVTVASTNFTFHNREGDSVLWFSYSLSPNGATAHHFSLPETIYCVHCNDGAASVLEASLEREVRRSVDEVCGVVVRYFESGATQTLFPDGALLHRFKEVHIPVDSSQDGLFSYGQESEKFCETLTLTSGAVFVRSVYSNNTQTFMFDTDSVGESFHRLNVVQELHVTYDPTNHCHTIAREDGVTVVYYYSRHASLWGEGTNEMGMRQENQMEILPAQEEYLRTSSSFSTVVPLAQTLNDQLRKVDAWDGTITSADTKHGVSMDDIPEVYARVTLHPDGTSVTTFTDSAAEFDGTGVTSDPATRTVNSTSSGGGDVLSSFVAPSILSLLNDTRVVRAACQGAVKWCIESPRTPRIFLISLPDRLHQLQQTMEEWYLSFNSTERVSMQTTGSDFQQYDSFYMVFGDGSVLKRHLLSRPTRGTIVPFLETVLSRPTDTAVRVIHDNGLVVVERSADVKRNFENAAAAAIGEGFGVFDLALGGFRLVDYLSHVTEVQGVYSPYGVTAAINAVSWETLLKQLVHDTYSAHRLPKAQMEAMAAKKQKEEEEERRVRAEGKCPTLVHRMRELAEEFIISNGLLKPDVLHTLEKASKAKKGLDRDDFQKAFAESQTTHSGVLTTTLGQVSPVFFCQRANGEVVQFLSDQTLETIVEKEGQAEMNPDPIYLLRSTAAGEPGVQQLSLFRISSTESESPPSYSSTTAELLSGVTGRGAHKANRNDVSEPGSLRHAMEQQRKLSAFYNGTSYAAHYHHSDNPVFDTTIAEPSQFIGGFSRWQPRECQPPRRFLKPAARRERKKRGVVVLQEEDKPITQTSSHEGVRTFLQFQPVSSTATNTVLNAELQRHRQLGDLTKYHQVMESSFPPIPTEAIEEQKRLQQLYFSMRAKTAGAGAAVK